MLTSQLIIQYFRGSRLKGDINKVLDFTCIVKNEYNSIFHHLGFSGDEITENISPILKLAIAAVENVALPVDLNKKHPYPKHCWKRISCMAFSLDPTGLIDLWGLRLYY